jgi:hypothetical protein
LGCAANGCVNRLHVTRVYLTFHGLVVIHQGRDPCLGAPRCSSLQTVARGLANRGYFRLTFRANARRLGLTLAANGPTLNANSLQTAR